jgi:DNA sulfur modification protein DndD
MKINSIVLNNIGPYVGRNKFDFQTDKSHNVILIGGKNGAGKTTLLKAIKIGLFGCYAYGYKSENATYLKEIKNFINNRAIGDFYIEISFEYIENYEKFFYTIKRCWYFNRKEELDEFYEIYNETERLSDYESLELLNKLKSITSPALINSFIYDGEKISSIIEQGAFSEYIKEIFYSIFNIDVLESLSFDLNSYLSKADKSSISPIQYEISQIINKINYMKSDIKSYKTRIDNLEKEKIELNLKIKAVNNEFAKLDGLSKDQIESYKKSISAIEHENEDSSHTLRIFYEESLPITLVKAQIQEIIELGRKEIPVQYAEKLIEISKYLNVDFSNYIDRLQCNSNNKIIFNLTEQRIANLEDILQKAESERSVVRRLITKKNMAQSQMTLLKSKVDNAETTERLNVILDSLAKLHQELLMKEETLVDLKNINKDKEEELNKLIYKYEQLCAGLKKDKQASNSYVLGTVAAKICEKFKSQVIVSKLNVVAEMSCKIFNETIRKINYIAKFQFDKNFSLRIFDSFGMEVKLDTLSAGEMQILVSSVIWAMFKVSGRREMFVFDTPLARLDSENRIQFINKIVSTISEQVVVLSTDSEFVNENYNAIKDRIKTHYLLSYDDDAKKAVITSAYFGEIL